MNPWKPLLIGLFLVLIPKSILSYLLNPFPGSQSLDSITAVYYLGKIVPVVQLLGFLLAAYGLFVLLRARKSTVQRFGAISVGILAGLALLGLRQVNAPVMFEEPENISFAKGTSDVLPGSTIVIGIAGKDSAKAYPVRLLAYHHRFKDDLDSTPIWVTYCSMCRTGKVFSPLVSDKSMEFELVGAIQYNSIYRDVDSGSLWYQANGRAAIGPMAGERLTEFRVDQMTLEQWLELFPDSQVLQPDPAATSGYQMFGFDQWDQRRSDDSELPEFRWVVGVEHGDTACAYRWAQLRAAGLIQDSVDELPVAVRLAPDGVSFRVWDRRVNGEALELTPAAGGTMLHIPSNTVFGVDGVGQGGSLAGEKLLSVSATVEFAHSFQTFSGGEYCPKTM